MIEDKEYDVSSMAYIPEIRDIHGRGMYDPGAVLLAYHLIG